MKNSTAAIIVILSLVGGVAVFFMVTGLPGQTDPEPAGPQMSIVAQDKGPFPLTPVLDAQKTRTLHPDLDHLFQEAQEDGAATENDRSVFQPYWDYIMAELGQDPVHTRSVYLAYDGRSFSVEVEGIE